jgi:transcriptional regulator with XRE-family HTH domain
MINLRIQEFAEAKSLSLEELSKLSSVPLQDIQSYTTLETLTEEIAANLRKIAAKLNVPVLELVKPLAKREAFKLKIIEIAEQKGLTLEELSKLSGLNLAFLAFYSTQSMCKQKLENMESQHQHLTKIAKALDCNIEDLQEEAELPTTKLRFEELVQERGLTTDAFSMLTELPHEFLDLMTTQPLDISASVGETDEPPSGLVMTLGNRLIEKKICDWLPPGFPGCPRR